MHRLDHNSSGVNDCEWEKTGRTGGIRNILMWRIGNDTEWGDTACIAPCYKFLLSTSNKEVSRRRAIRLRIHEDCIVYLGLKRWGGKGD